MVQKVLVKLRGTERQRGLLDGLLGQLAGLPRATAFLSRLVRAWTSTAHSRLNGFYLIERLSNLLDRPWTQGQGTDTGSVPPTPAVSTSRARS